MPYTRKFTKLMANVMKNYVGKVGRDGVRITKAGAKSIAFAIGKSRGFQT